MAKAVQYVPMTPMEPAFKWVCRKCGHKWFQRGEERPKRCPHPGCATVAWDREEFTRGRKPKKHKREKRRKRTRP